MAPIIPAGGKKYDWVLDPAQAIEKKAQDMFEDDPQLSAIKGLPGMQDGISELEQMSTEVAPPLGEVSEITEIVPEVGGAVEQAIEKVKDAAQDVADAAVKDVEKAVNEAVKNVGKPVVEVKEVAEIAHEESETPAEEAKEEHEKSETPEKEAKEEECAAIPGVEGEKDGKVEKEGDKEDDKKDGKPAFAASKGMRRLAELAPGEVKDLRHY